MKTYRGYELMQAIAEGEIKEETNFNAYKNGKLYFSRLYYKNGVLRENGILLTEFLTLKDILMLEFELIEDEEIDIQAIEKLNTVRSIKTTGDEDNIKEYVKSTNKIIVDNFYKVNDVIKMQNKLVQAVKQLEKRTRKEKE